MLLISSLFCCFCIYHSREISKNLEKIQDVFGDFLEICMLQCTQIQNQHQNSFGGFILCEFY
ncbi:hypothetical protein DW667_07365 [Coprococcus sp. AM25-15LB]|nr:hypothetical protein DW667_07365 [Coprococcus sp. AM25-15LB]RJW08614.1 hypothetical protein DW686_06020 [Coprococcus sp. AM25-4LB]